MNRKVFLSWGKRLMAWLLLASLLSNCTIGGYRLVVIKETPTATTTPTATPRPATPTATASPTPDPFVINGYTVHNPITREFILEHPELPWDLKFEEIYGHSPNWFIPTPAATDQAALEQGKLVAIPSHPSDLTFAQFADIYFDALTSNKLEFPNVPVDIYYFHGRDHKPFFDSCEPDGRFGAVRCDFTIEQTPVTQDIVMKYDDAFVEVLQTTFFLANQYHKCLQAYKDDIATNPTEQDKANIENWTTDYIQLASHYAAETIEHFDTRFMPFDELSTEQQAEQLLPIGFQYKSFVRRRGYMMTDMTWQYAGGYSPYFLNFQDPQGVVHELNFDRAHHLIPAIDLEFVEPAPIGDLALFTQQVDELYDRTMQTKVDFPEPWEWFQAIQADQHGEIGDTHHWGNYQEIVLNPAGWVSFEDGRMVRFKSNNVIYPQEMTSFSILNYADDPTQVLPGQWTDDPTFTQDQAREVYETDAFEEIFTHIHETPQPYQDMLKTLLTANKVWVETYGDEPEVGHGAPNLAATSIVLERAGYPVVLIGYPLEVKGSEYINDALAQGPVCGEYSCPINILDIALQDPTTGQVYSAIELKDWNHRNGWEQETGHSGERISNELLVFKPAFNPEAGILYWTAQQPAGATAAGSATPTATPSAAPTPTATPSIAAPTPTP